MTKQCFKCKKILPLEMFYKHPKMADGRIGKCKECSKKDVRENRELKIDYYLEYDRNRANLPASVHARESYAKTANGRFSALRARKKWVAENTIKKHASTLIGNAVRDGKIIKPNSCEVCGVKPSRLHGHHDDYAYPMTVRWLCSKCHCAWHKLNGSAKNG